MPLALKLALEIVTPEGLLLRDEVDEVIAPGERGSFGVRPGHTPLMATLGLGELSYRKESAWHRLTCFSGWCEVLPDRVTVLAQVAELPAEIDLEAARKQLAEAEAALPKAAAESIDALNDALRLAETRLEVGGGTN